MKESKKDKILECIEKSNKENDLDDIQELISNLSIKKKKNLTESNDIGVDYKTKTNIEEETQKENLIKEEATEIIEKESSYEDKLQKSLENDEQSSSNEDDEQKTLEPKLNEDFANSDSESSNESSDANASEKEDEEEDEKEKEEVEKEKEEEEENDDEVDSLKAEFSLFNLGDESEEDEPNYLKRGPLTDHRNNMYRFTPLNSQQCHQNQNNLHYHSPAHENSNSSVFDVVEFPQLSGAEAFSQGYGLNQSCGGYFTSGDGYLNNNNNNNNNFPLSPESVHSQNSLSPQYTTNFPTNLNQTDCQYPSEFSNEGWSNVSSHVSDSSSYDFGNKGFESYQPLSPPQSVSPFLKDGHDSNQFGNLGEHENIKDSEDLINIINTVNRTYNTNAKGIPESELVKLRSVLEGNEESIRNEMGMYLKDGDSHFQPSFNHLEDSSLNDSASEFAFNYEAPLTPPKSVSPIQEGLSCSSDSPVPQFRGGKEFDNCQSDEHLIDILNGIDEINPEELNIYLDEESNACDPSYARNVIQARCKPNNLDHALRRLSSISTKYLCKKDNDGDTCLMIVYSKPEDSPDFYENIFCLQEKVREIKVCCDTPLGKAKRCKVCGNTDPLKFYTPLSLKNKQGDTALSCAVKTDHSPIIISYLLHGILQCPEDFKRVFDEKGKSMLADVAYKYPCLSPYV